MKPAALVVAAAVASAGLALSLVVAGSADDGSAARSDSGSATNARPGPADAAPRVAVQRAGDGRVAAPARVRVPTLSIDSALDPLTVTNGGALESPPRWQVAGWYADGPRPGAAGPAVVAGHVDSPDGPAVFAELDRIAVGDTIEVVDVDGGVVRFAVDRVRTVARSDFPTQAVYGPTPDAQLRLITCDGPFVGGSYRDNLVVFATEVTT